MSQSPDTPDPVPTGNALHLVPPRAVRAWTEADAVPELTRGEAVLVVPVGLVDLSHVRLRIVDASGRFLGEIGQ